MANYSMLSIGAGHKEYNQSIKDYTSLRQPQILIQDSGLITIASFYGPMAKIHAAVFISSIGRYVI